MTSSPPTLYDNLGIERQRASEMSQIAESARVHAATKDIMLKRYEKDDWLRMMMMRMVFSIIIVIIIIINFIIITIIMYCMYSVGCKPVWLSPGN